MHELSSTQLPSRLPAISLAPVLNYDILLEVLNVSETRADCARFTRTARFFNTYGYKTLLSLDTLSFLKEDHLLSFLAALRRDPGRRYQGVVFLELWFFDITEPAALQLADALYLMSNLEELFIRFSEDVILSHLSLVDAFASLTSVRELSINGAGMHTVKMLQSLRSQLASLRIEFYAPGEEEGEEGFFDELPEDQWPLYHPAIVLEHSRASLKSVISYGWRMDADILPDSGLVYPQMRDLEIERSLLPRTVSLIQAYPNLDFLSFQTNDYEASQLSTAERRLYNARHMLNITEQVERGPAWTVLPSYSGCLLDLYLLGLSCPIDTIWLHGLHSDLLYMLDIVLARARPRKLRLKEWPRRLHGLPEDVFAELRGQNSSRLETLNISGGLEFEDGTVDVAAVLEGLRTSLKGASLQELEMEISMTRPDPGAADDPSMSEITMLCRRHRRTPPPSNPDDYPLCFAERSGEDFDLEDYLRRFMEDYPTLRRVDVTLRGPRDRLRKATLVDGQLQVEDGRVTRGK